MLEIILFVTGLICFTAFLFRYKNDSYLSSYEAIEAEELGMNEADYQVLKSVRVAYSRVTNDRKRSY